MKGELDIHKAGGSFLIDNCRDSLDFRYSLRFWNEVFDLGKIIFLLWVLVSFIKLESLGGKKSTFPRSMLQNSSSLGYKYMQ